jgi:hypothetical protein
MKFGLTLIVLTLSTFSVGRAQQPGSQTMLDEMQRLRKAVERSTILNTQALITTHRVTMQQQRVVVS